MDMTVGLYTSLLGITWFCVGWAVALAKATGSYAAKRMRLQQSWLLLR